MCFSIDTNKIHREKYIIILITKNGFPTYVLKKQREYLNDDMLYNVYNHHFIISPYGNGIDYGRTWMALQLGCIPIIPYHICFKNLRKNYP